MTTVALSDADPPLVMTIDAGTSSVRVLLFDRAGRSVAEVAAQEQYTIHTAADGRSEADPDELLERIGRCVDRASAQAGPRAREIGGVAIATLVSNILALDAAGRPLTPLITYADTRN